MSKKINPMLVAIGILAIILIVIICVFVFSNNEEESSEVLSTDIKSSIQTIENTLSSSGQVNAALDEKILLRTGYYYESMLVKENAFIEEGTNIIEYTNGTYLTAPYDCVVVSSNLPNEEEKCTSSHYIQIQSIDTLMMSLSVSESDINKVEVGDKVDIKITTTEEEIEGYITMVSEVGTYSSSGSYFVAEVEFANTGNIKIGMSATCEIIIESAEDVVAVPIEAVQTSDEGKYVVAIKEDGTTENIFVEIGISNDAYIEIKDGLEEGIKIEVPESTESTSGNFRMNSGRGGMNFEGGRSQGSMPSFEGMPTMPQGGMPNF